MSEDPSNRRWLQFGLKTAVLVMLLCALLAGYTAWWMRRLQESEAKADAAHRQAELAQRQAQAAVNQARAAESLAREKARMALAQAAISRKIRELTDAKLRALAGDSPADEGPVAAPPEDEEFDPVQAPDGR